MYIVQRNKFPWTWICASSACQGPLLESWRKQSPGMALVWSKRNWRPDVSAQDGCLNVSWRYCSRSSLPFQPSKRSSSDFWSASWCSYLSLWSTPTWTLRRWDLTDSRLIFITLNFLSTNGHLISVHQHFNTLIIFANLFCSHINVVSLLRMRVHLDGIHILQVWITINFRVL